MKTGWLCLALLLVGASHASAETGDVTQSKAYFKAGAAAYEMGDFLAAIQALDAAYRLTPLPAIGFSLAQAERRQYFVSHERVHLDRAIQLFRDYLQQNSSGGRRADAADALAQLEPLAAIGASATGTPGEAIAPPVERTRLLISCETPHATLSLDGAPPAASPLIAQVKPGPHHVLAAAEGFFPTERTVNAIPGELLPIELALREKPAVVLAGSTPEADLHVDGAFIANVGATKRLELSGGTHLFSFTRNGYEVEAVEMRLQPGGTHKLDANLNETGQRTTAIALFIASGASLAGGLVLGAYAIARENDAKAVLRQRETGNISSGQREDYESASQERDVFRIASIVSLATSAAALITGVFLYVLDTPDVAEALEPGKLDSRRAQLRVQPGTRGYDVRVAF
jgi:tetratricopeptide (TPR) repeat protein